MPGAKTSAYTNGLRKTLILEKTKSVSYNAATSDQIFSISSDVSATTASSIPNAIEVQNNGSIPVFVITGYESYDAVGTGDADTEYLHTLLMPGETYTPSIRAIIVNSNTNVVIDGTVADNEVPNSNIRLASGTTLAAHVDSPDTAITVIAGGYFRGGDLIQLGDDSATISKVEIMEVTKIATHVLTVTRGLYGSNINDKDAQTDGTDGSVSGANVSFPFFNSSCKPFKYSMSLIIPKLSYCDSKFLRVPSLEFK